ncbi:MAG: hypothetical protein KME35_12100 [Aphanocapsa sp. GSE-SYN-MK-11-07L]|jgi:hypothetical protein|nr:hypothetical protein [Aphanocapsa sp. GSE-SYN-MK-11-07L]
MKDFKNARLVLLLISQLSKAQTKQDQGFVLLVAIFLGVVLLGLLTAYAITTRSESVSATGTKDATSGFYAAEAGINLRSEAIRQTFLGFNQPAGTPPSSTNCISTDPDGTNDFRCITYDFAPPTPGSASRLVSTYVVDSTVRDPATGAPTIGRVPSGDSFQNLNMQEYTYQLYSVTRKKVNLDTSGQTTQDSPSEAIVQMTLRSRLIPMFQFAAFYKNDLEISPGPRMLLTGPVHTNGRLMLAGWAGTGGLQINGQVTTAKQIYNAVVEDTCGGSCTTLSRTNANTNTQIRNAANTAWWNLLQRGTGSTSPTSNPMTLLDSPATNNWGTQIQTQIQEVTIPSTTFLRCDPSNDQAVFCSRADINFTYNPQTVTALTTPTDTELSAVPFSVLATNRTGTSPTASTPSVGQLRSLRQPVLVVPQTTTGISTARIPGTRGSVPATRQNLAATDSQIQGVCNAGTLTFTNGLSTTSLTATQQTQVQNALRVALAAQLRPVPFSQLATNLPNTIPGTRPNAVTGTLPNLVAHDFRQSLVNQGNTTSANAILTALRGTGNLPSLNMIAKAAGESCFVAAPVQEVLVFDNDREDRNIRLLQVNVASMAIWNKDNAWIPFAGSGISTDTPTIPTSGIATNTDQALYVRLAADSAAPADSFQQFGYAAADRSDGGMVVHFTLSATAAATYTAPASPYGFGITGARQLFGRARYGGASFTPAGVTFASDQAIYSQGDFNNFLTNPNDSSYDPGSLPDITNTGFNGLYPTTLVWQPASIISDSFNSLSNACLSANQAINKTGNGQNCAGGGASNTTTRAGLLAGTDITGEGTDTQKDPITGALDTLTSVAGFSGGLQNYPRYFENWGNTRGHFYYGSFVSLGIPRQANGQWDNQEYNPPRRVWGYDERFNDAANLPPLTPRFVALQQDVFTRQFGQ